MITHAVLLMNSCRFLCTYSVIVSVFIFCHCSIKRLLNLYAITAYTDSCDCFANYITNMNYNIRLTVISISCKNCPIGCPYNLFLRFPPLRVGAGFSSLAFSTPAIWCRVSSSVFSTPVFLTVPDFPVSRFQSPRCELLAL